MQIVLSVSWPRKVKAVWVAKSFETEIQWNQTDLSLSGSLKLLKLFFFLHGFAVDLRDLYYTCKCSGCSATRYYFYVCQYLSM